MKVFTVTIAVFFLFQWNICAQDTASRSLTRLVASKNTLKASYKPGTRLLIQHGRDTSIAKSRGILSEVYDHQIAIKRSKNSKEQELIRIEDITRLRKSNPNQRILYGVIGTVMVAGGAAIISRGGSTPGSAMATALIIPVVGIGSYLLCAVPLSLLIEKTNEKIRSWGWKFSTQ